MRVVFPVWLCAVVALGFGVVAADAVGQAGHGEATQSEQQISEDPFGFGDRPSAPPATLCRCLGDSDGVARTKQILAQPLHSVGIEFAEEPLENVVNFITEEYGIPIQIDTAALEDCGLTADEPVTISVRGTTLKSALLWMLTNLNLTYMISNEMVIVTTGDVSEENAVACVYDVRDLANDSRPINALMDAITSCIAPETWAEAGGGEAEIRPLQPGLLVVLQTSPIQDQIAELLTAIRAMRHGTPKRAPRPSPKPAPAEPPSESAPQPTPAEEDPFGN